MRSRRTGEYSSIIPGLDAYLTTPPEYPEISGTATISVERPLPLVTSDHDLAWTLLLVEVEVSCGEVAGATLKGSMTLVVLTEIEERRAIESVGEHHDEDDHYYDEDCDEDRCERRRERMEAME